MKSQYKTALGIGGLVVGTVVVGLGLFLYTGSQLGVYFIFGGAPVVAISAVAVYVQRQVRPSQVDQADFARQRANGVAESIRSFWKTYDRLRERYPEWEARTTENDFSQLLRNAEKNGIEFDREAGQYTTGGTGDVRELNALEDDVEVLATVRDESFESFARDRLASADALTPLVERDLVSESSVRTPDAGELESVSEADAPERYDELLQTYDRTARAALDEARAEVERLAEERGLDRTVVADDLTEAEGAAQSGDYGRAVDATVRALGRVESELADEFDADRRSVEALLDTVESSVADQYVSPSLLDEVESVRREVEQVDSALDVDVLESHASTLRETCTAMVEEMQTELADDVETLSDAPPSFTTIPDAAGTDHVTRLDSTTNLEAFRRAWLSTVGDLSTGLDTTERDAAVVEAYPGVEDEIADALRANGEVTPADVPVRDAGPFFELFAAQHPDASYAPSDERLTTGGAGERYALDVRPRFETGGDERELRVEVDGANYAEESSTRTHLVGQVAFESVPYGEYDVTADTPADGYVAESTTVYLDDDTTVELTVSEASLAERVCDGQQSALHDELPELAPELDRKLDEDGYVDPSMSFPIRDDFVPCLLAMWGEQSDGRACLDGGDVLVFDESRLTNRLENILTHNLSSGDSMSYDTMRERYLTVPASDQLLEELVTGVQTNVDASFTVGQSEVTKQ